MLEPYIPRFLFTSTAFRTVYSNPQPGLQHLASRSASSKRGTGVQNVFWEVVYLPLWKIWVRQLGWFFHSQLNGKNKKRSKPPTSFCFWTWFIQKIRRSATYEFWWTTVPATFFTQVRANFCHPGNMARTKKNITRLSAPKVAYGCPIKHRYFIYKCSSSFVISIDINIYM